MGIFSPPHACAQADEAVGEASSEGPPARGELSWDVLGGEGWYPRLYAGVTEVYTDNVFNTEDEEESDFITIVSLGARLSIPRRQQQESLKLDTSNVAPGGLKLSRPAPEVFTRFAAFLHYRADMSYHSRFASEDATAHTAEGLLQYNSALDLTLEAVDRFEKSFDPRGTSESGELDKFASNHFGALISYALGERVSLRADYENYFVDYESESNDFRDRTDNGFSGYVYFRVKPRTSLFVQYEFIDIAYDDGANDSQEQHYLGGLTYKITGRSEGTVKAGWGEKDFVDPEDADTEDFVFEGVLDHRFDDQKSINLEAAMKTTESNISTAGYIFSKSVAAKYGHAFMPRFSGSLRLSYEDDEYRNTEDEEGRRDDVYTGTVELTYTLTHWARATLGYVYTMRDSSSAGFDFTSNTVFLSVFASM